MSNADVASREQTRRWAPRWPRLKKQEEILMSKQKANQAQAGPTGTVGLDELNHALAKGWTVKHVSPLGGAATGTQAEAALCVGALVILQLNDRMEMDLPLVEEEELLDDLLEGDGANADVDPAT